MNALILVVPILLLRYGFMRLVSKTGFIRAAYFPPVEGKERIALVIYNIFSLALFVYLAFFEIKLTTSANFLGLGVYLIGIILYMRSIVDFAKPNESNFSKTGLFKYSRNPMYVAFFLYFVGCSLLIESWIYCVILVIFQISVHYIIISEERWCIKTFGNEYIDYLLKVRRYL